MATARPQEATCRIVQDSILELQTSDTKPSGKSESYYTGIAVMADRLVVTDIVAGNLQIFNRQDGTLICTENLEGKPFDVCVLSDTEFAVCLVCKIVIMSVTANGVTRVKSLDLSKGFYYCNSVSKWREDKMIVSGRRKVGDTSMLCWSVVYTDGRIGSTCDICTGLDFTKGYDTKVTVTDNTVYVSCCVSDSTKSAVYAFDVLNPQKPKFVYQHEKLEDPRSIMADRGNIFVCDRKSKTVYQLSETGHLLTIHPIQSDVLAWYHDVQHGLLYTTSWNSNKITLYKLEHQQPSHVPIQNLAMDDRSIQHFEEDLKEKHDTVFSIRILVAGQTDVDKMTLLKRLLGDSVKILEGSGKESIDVYVRCSDVSKKEKMHRRVLNRCLPELMDDLELKTVLPYIQQKEIFEDVIISDIREQKTSSDSITLLIESLKKKPQDAYEKFKDCLVNSGQEHLKKSLDETEKKLSTEMNETK